MNGTPSGTKRALATAAVALLTVLVVGCATNRTAGRQLDDATITSKIQAKLTADTEINSTNVDVDTFDGVVTLRGEVEKQYTRDEAERLARNTDGVLGVDNRLRVVSAAEEDDQTVSDSWITTKIKSKLTADPELNPFNIDVDTLDGVVTLSGAVASEAKRAEVERLARGTRGVVDVVNELQIRPR